MKFIPKIVYGSGPTTLTLTLPQKLWEPSARPRGGSAVSDAGVPESFIVRRDQLLNLEIRFTEVEWSNIDAWLAFGQSGQAFTFYPDKDVGTNYSVYLESPTVGDGEVKPSRDSFTSHFNIPVVLRSTTGTLFDVRVF